LFIFYIYNREVNKTTTNRTWPWNFGRLGGWRQSHNFNKQ